MKGWEYRQLLLVQSALKGMLHMEIKVKAGEGTCHHHLNGQRSVPHLDDCNSYQNFGSTLWPPPP